MTEQKKQGKAGILVLLLGGLLVLLVILALPLIRAREAGLKAGSEAPDFTFTDFEGSTHTLSSYRGNVVVINFWASWCDPCAEEAAILEQAYQEYGDEDVVFLGIAYSDTESKSRAYVDDYGVTYPNGPDKGTKISPEYHVAGVPETFIIDPAGVLAAVKIGPFSSLEELETLILQAK